MVFSCALLGLAFAVIWVIALHPVTEAQTSNAARAGNVTDSEIAVIPDPFGRNVTSDQRWLAEGGSRVIQFGLKLAF